MMHLSAIRRGGALSRALTLALGLGLAVAVGGLAAAMPELVEVKTVVKLLAICGFCVVVAVDLEWGYWLFVLLVCCMPSRFNQEVYSLGILHFTVFDPILGLIFAVWLLRLMKLQQAPRLSYHLLWLFSLLAFVLISSSFSLGKYLSLGKLLAGVQDWVRVGLFFIITYQLLDSTRRLEGYYRALATGSFLVAGYGIYSYFFVKSNFAFAGGPVKAFSFEKRLIVGSLIGGGATTLAGFLTLTMPLVFTRWLKAQRPWERLILLGVLATQGLMLVLTFSRGGWLSLGVALLLGLLVMSRNALKILLSLCLFAALLLLLWRFMPLEVHKRFETVYNPRNEVNLQRLEIWQTAMNNFKSSPLLGTGPNNIYNTAIAFNQAERFPIYISPYHPHNWLLLSLVENGILGSLLLFGYLLFVLFSGLLRLRSLPPGRLTGWEYGVWAGAIGFMLHNLVDYFLWQPRMSFLFWLVILLIVRLTLEPVVEQRT